MIAVRGGESSHGEVKTSVKGKNAKCTRKMVKLKGKKSNVPRHQQIRHMSHRTVLGEWL